MRRDGESDFVQYQALVVLQCFNPEVLETGLSENSGIVVSNIVMSCKTMRRKVTYEGETSLSVVKLGSKDDRCRGRVGNKSNVRQSVRVFDDRQREKLVEDHDAGVSCLRGDFESRGNLSIHENVVSGGVERSGKHRMVDDSESVFTCFIHKMACALFPSFVDSSERMCAEEKSPRVPLMRFIMLHSLVDAPSFPVDF